VSVNRPRLVLLVYHDIVTLIYRLFKPVRIILFFYDMETCRCIRLECWMLRLFAASTEMVVVRLEDHDAVIIVSF